MSFMNLFRKRHAADKGHIPESNVLAKYANFPESIKLARRHHEERTAAGAVPHAGTESSADPENWQTLTMRHKAELGDTVVGLSELDGLRTKTAYHALLASLTSAHTETVAARRHEEDPKLAAHEAATDRYVTDLGKAQPVPTWVSDAYKRGLENGALVMGADGGDRLRICEEQEAIRAAWAAKLPADQEAIANLVFQEGSSNGMVETAQQKSLLKPSSFGDTQGAAVRFLAGDLGQGKGYVLASGKVRIPSGTLDFAMSALESVEMASEESVKRVGGALGWGLAGGALFGPAGLVVGGVLGGKGTDVTFIGTLRDGKRFLASARSETYVKFRSATFS